MNRHAGWWIGGATATVVLFVIVWFVAGGDGVGARLATVGTVVGGIAAAVAAIASLVSARASSSAAHDARETAARAREALALVVKPTVRPDKPHVPIDHPPHEAAKLNFPWRIGVRCFSANEAINVGIRVEVGDRKFTDQCAVLRLSETLMTEELDLKVPIWDESWRGEGTLPIRTEYEFEDARRVQRWRGLDSGVVRYARTGDRVMLRYEHTGGHEPRMVPTDAR